MWSPAALALVLAAPAPGSAEVAVHRVSIEIRGPVALVQVERSIPVDEARREESTLDLALPEGAALVSWEASELRLAPAEELRARKEHAAALAARALAPTRLALDEGTDFRVHVAGQGRALLRYRYAAPLTCRRGRFVLALPGSLEAEPLPAEVTVAVSPGAGARLANLDVAGVPARIARGASPVRASAKAPARAAWEVSFALHTAGARFPVQILAAAGPVPAIGRTGSETAVALGVCRPDATVEKAPPERLLLVIDRSRSVGPAGIVNERDVARALVEALPPSVRFNAVFFDRVARPLFPVARGATEEALLALEAQAGPGQLQNGTEIARALRAAGDLARAEGEARPTWLALITDGALPEGLAGAALVEAAAGLPAAKTEALVLLVRPGGDEPASAPAQAVLRALPAHFGGILRSLDPADVRGGIAEVVKAARAGGDLFSVGVGKKDAIDVAAPGAGQVRIVRMGRDASLTLRARRSGAAMSAPLQPAPIARTWMAALATRPAARMAWVASASNRLAWVEPGQASAAPEDEISRGEMDRMVVRNALSLAYLPRARACYLGRRIQTAGDFDLRGRLRLELTLERGEMIQAVVRNSTLNRPEIEACLREAAFGIEVPRPLHRDAPVVAALNLRFQPRTPSQQPPDNSALSHEIDLLVGPPSLPSDPRQLLEDLAR